MLSLSDFHPYQHRAVDHVCDNPRSMLWLFMSSGKSSITLTAIDRLANDFKVYGTLVLAPRLVAETVWRQEVKKWSHLQHLRVCLLRGPKEQKLRDLHRRDCDIWVINYESIPWLVRALNDQFLARGKYLPFNMLVMDEIDRLKNAQGKRFSELELLLKDHFAYRVGLTGTPASNGYIDLHGQYLAVDGGKRLYKNVGDFRTKWFRPGYAMQSWSLAEGAKDEIHDRIADITLSMRAEDYLSLPDYQYIDHWVDLDPKVQKEYDHLEKEMFAQLDRHEDDPLDGEWTLEVHCVLSARAKCRQLANGAVLNPDNSGTVMLVHDMKLEMLDSIMHEAAGSPILLAYMYRHDMYRIKERYEKQGYKVGYLGPGTKDPQSVVDAWNAGHYNLLQSHPLCLREDTQVLTEERGWVRITDVLYAERVFDGVEFVQHEGCTYSGYEHVIDVFGIKMTPKHRLLVAGKWVEAKNVGTDTETREKARYAVQGDAPSPGEMRKVRGCARVDRTELPEAQPPEKRILRGLYRRDFSPYDRYKNTPYLERYAKQMLRTRNEKLRALWWTWHSSMRKVAFVQRVLRGYAARILRWADHRTQGHQWALLQGELPLGYQHGATGQQAQQPRAGVPGGDYALGRVMSEDGGEQNEDAVSTERRDDPRGSSGEREGIYLRNRKDGNERAHVYDLVNCGPRNRFLIRNDAGEMFISHNSVGHGLNLQGGGSEIVWFSPTDNLALYQQLNARLRRQGQTASNVRIRHILARRTVDEMLTKLIKLKDATQEELRDAIEAYRRSK